MKQIIFITIIVIALQYIPIEETHKTKCGIHSRNACFEFCLTAQYSKVNND